MDTFFQILLDKLGLQKQKFVENVIKYKKLNMSTWKFKKLYKVKGQVQEKLQ